MVRAGSNANVDTWAFDRHNAQALISVYPLRMAAVFTLSVSTVSLRAGAVPFWVLYLGYLAALVLPLAAAEQKWAQLDFPAWVLLLRITLLFSRQISQRQLQDPPNPWNRPGRNSANLQLGQED
jgi:hypothetical protein